MRLEFFSRDHRLSFLLYSLPFLNLSVVELGLLEEGQNDMVDCCIHDVGNLKMDTQTDVDLHHNCFDVPHMVKGNLVVVETQTVVVEY